MRIKINHQLIHSNTHDRNRVYSTLKKFRKEKTKPTTQILNTPVGTYYCSDVLEGFAADAENLGKQTPDINRFDNYFYNLCKLDNLYIFNFHGSDSVKLPPMKMSDLKRNPKHTFLLLVIQSRFY